jgi:plastocyanin
MPTIIIVMDKRCILILLILTVLIVAISGCIDDNVDPVTSANRTIINTSVTPTPGFPVPEPLTVYVEIKGSTFNPLQLKIVNGTTVKWTNADSVSYILNVDDVQSPVLNKRDSWNHTFNKTGIFGYNSSNHPAMPHGKIIVEK